MPVAVTASILLMLATGAWTAVLATSPHSYDGTSVVLMATSLWVATVAALTGMVVSRSRWARRAALGTTAAHAVLAAACPVVPVWWLGAALTAGAAVLLAGPWLTGVIRSLPNASGPPTRAVLVPLLLVATPFAIGICGGTGLAAALTGGGALVAAFWFIRTLPFALTLVRVAWPVLALACALPLGWPAGMAAALSGVGVSAVAWHRSVTTAVIPLVSRGTVVPIPPELAPRDVLDAARLDERGRPR